MYTPTQLEAIKIFGRKDLTEGCFIYCPTYEGGTYISINKLNIKDATSSQFGIYLPIRYGNGKATYPFEILGHIPHLEDVFRAAKDKKFHYIDITHLSDGTHELCFAWTGETDDEAIKYNPTIPLLEQSESTLQQLISLFE